MFAFTLAVLSSAYLRKVSDPHASMAEVAYAEVKGNTGTQVMHGVAPTKDEACAACVEAAGATPTWTNYCQCFVTNSNKWGSTAGGFSYETESVEDRYYWNCGPAAGEGYSVCSASTGSLYGDRGAGSGQEAFDDVTKR